MYTTDRKPDTKPAIVVGVVASMLLHVPLVVLMIWILVPDDSSLEALPATRASELVVDLQREADAEEEEADDDDEELALQHISAEAPEREETPEEARFADQWESRTDEPETVRRGTPGAPEEIATAVESRDSSQGQDQQTEEMAREVAEEDLPEARDDQEHDFASGDAADDEVAQGDGETDAEAGPQVDPKDLFPTISNSRHINPLGDAGSIDWMRDVSESERTLLNRKRSRYWAFFERVKLQISEQWSPVAEYRRRDPYGNVYGVQDRYSTVHVTLNGDGSVRQLYLQRPSGLDFYDDEAVRAIRAAAPFHNPPEGLKDEDGYVHFTFGFYFEITSGRFRFIRVSN